MLVAVATGCAGIGVADGVASTMRTPRGPTESGMNIGFRAGFEAGFGAGFRAGFEAGFGDGAEFTNDSRVNDAMRHQGKSG